MTKIDGLFSSSSIVPGFFHIQIKRSLLKAMAVSPDQFSFFILRKEIITERRPQFLQSGL